MKNFKRKAISFILDVLFDIVGSFIMAVGIYTFSEAANIAPGGASGIAIMIKYLFNAPVGLMTLIINIPLLFLAYRYMGKAFTWKTLKTLLISTVILDSVVTPYLPQYTGDRMIGSIFGGVGMGLGLAIIFLRGSTTAGTDIISHLIERRFPHIQIGRALMLIDCVILAASVAVFRNLESGLFGLIALFCQTRIIDSILYGMDKGSMVTIMSRHNEAIAQRVIREMTRTATLLKGWGAYRMEDCKVLLCAVRKAEFHQLKAIVREEDPDAFIIVNEANQILGEGFKEEN